MSQRRNTTSVSTTTTSVILAAPIKLDILLPYWSHELHSLKNEVDVLYSQSQAVTTIHGHFLWQRCKVHENLSIVIGCSTPFTSCTTNIWPERPPTPLEVIISTVLYFWGLVLTNIHRHTVASQDIHSGWPIFL